MKTFKGTVLFLDRADINTDEIIPAKYLTEIEKKALKPHLLEDLKLEGFDPKKNLKGVRVIISRSNFGCGSSREHAPWALEVNDIHCVIAPSFARIFRQNMFNGGMLALELPEEQIEHIFKKYKKKKDVKARIKFSKSVITLSAGKKEEDIPFVLAPFEAELVKAGGWVEYADARY
ncbi:MAG: 3-isopropylmalate dehydratase small subunit [Spirochaetales bacterium]|nr:MAG: 3-isopropylmalate dehydratase small subunit [Spirochaetales bacterium]